MIPERRRFAVRTAYPITISFVYLIQAALFYMMFYQQYRLEKESPYPAIQNWTSIWFVLGVAILLTIAAGFSIWQAFRPEYELELSEDRIKLRRVELGSQEIKKVYISGLDTDQIAIGIKPKGKLAVPNDFSFKINDTEQVGQQVREFLNWAKHHNIPVINRKSTSWM
ncbi:hypothetical protein [Saccharibacillus sp. JS10]|uniref:hypothetical protein n=1 Tax=Saccharibacillus sp. JS10 TaxID=2950552 RepID=UPI00210B3F6E|nr:hypothetical protein [Saccharibacillus sp. JS10]MCQ4087050.1 hypothetical protein [Saccharibacillus sp. JS10]